MADVGYFWLIPINFPTILDLFIFLFAALFIQVPPTRMNLGVFKQKHVAAKKGYDLLKSKADALKVRIMWINVVSFGVILFF